jgi:macrolide-specific efflux system membrane fusion protein
MDSKKKLTIISLLAILLSVCGWQFSTSLSSATDEKASTHTEIELGSVESVVTSQGTLGPKDYVDIGAQVSGMILRMHVEIGDQVKNGDLIAEIDPDVYEASVLANQAQLKNLQAQKAEKAAYLKQAQRKHERNTRLYKSKAVSQEALQDSESMHEIAQANLMAVDAQIEQAQSTLDAAQTNLQFTKIYSSMDGTVVSRYVQEGQTINANQTTPTIVQVANLDTMTVVAEVAEADVMKLKEGMPVYFSTLGSAERKWNGRVRQIEPTPVVENDVVLYNVLVDVKNSDRALMSGMTTQMFFILASAKDVPVIPISALKNRVESRDTDEGEAYRVMVEEEDGVKPRIIIIGAKDRSHAAVTKGLVLGDRVITGAKAKKKVSKTRSKSDQRGPRGPQGMGRI